MGLEIQRRSGSSICEDRRIYLWGIRDVLSPKQPRSMPRTAQVISLRAVVPPHSRLGYRCAGQGRGALVIGREGLSLLAYRSAERKKTCPECPQQGSGRG